MALALIYTFTIMPYLLAFEKLNPENPWYWIEVLVDVLFSIDILVILSTAYYDSEHSLITSRKKIFLNYLTGMMMIDLISIFPFYIFDNSRENRLLRFLKIARLVKILRASKIVTMLSSAKNSQRFSAIIKFLKINKGSIRLLGFLLIVLVLSHIAACLWFYSARLNQFDHDTWVFRYEMLDKDTMYLYLISLYWSFTTLTTVGYGDITAHTEDEIMLSLIWMMFGVGIYSFIIGSLTSLLQNYDARKTAIERRIKLMDVYSKENKIPFNLQSTINFYL
jgi:hypothetical protein